MAFQRAFSLLGAFLLISTVLQSETIYSNFGTPGPDGSGGGFLLGPVGHPPPFSGFFCVAVPFVPTADYNLDSIDVPITMFTSTPLNQFTVEVRDSQLFPAGLFPGAVLERFSVTLAGFAVVDLKSSKHPLLTAGKRYWVTVLTDGGGWWGWGGLVHPTGSVYTLNTQSSFWQVSPPTSFIPGLQISGTRAAISLSSSKPVNVGSIPHIVSGGGWQTTFVLVNTAMTPSPAQLSFWDDRGSPLLIPLALPGSNQSTTDSSIQETIPGGASITVTATDTDSVKQGWASVTASEDVGVQAIIRSNSSGQEAGLSIENRNANSYLLTFDHIGGVRTGIAIANLSAIPVDVQVLMRDETGARLQRATVSLQARGHTSFDLADKLTNEIRGTIEFVTPEFGRISVVGLRFAPVDSGGLSLTAMPVLAK
jgi:hypothetical protein